MDAPSQYYIVDVSDSKCWNPIVIEYRDRILTVLNAMRPLYKSYLGAFSIGLGIYRISNGVIYYEDEISEIAKILDITFSECLLFQLTYELCSACTSTIILCDGEYVMTRTMDWALPDLKQITIRIRVVNKNNYLFEAVTWAGFVGIFTGIKTDKYAIALNYRRSLNPSFLANIMAVFKGHFPSAFYIRELLSSNGDTEEIANVKMIAPSYITVLTTDPKTSGVYICGRENAKFNLAPCIQTNCDSYGVGDNIMYSYERIKYMEQILDTDPTLDELIEYVSKFPVNNEDTIYSVIMTSKEVLYFNNLS